MPIAVQTQPSPRVQEVSSIIQIQGEHLVHWEDAIHTNSNSNLNPNSADKSVVNYNAIEYFLPGPMKGMTGEQVLK